MNNASSALHHIKRYARLYFPWDTLGRHRADEEGQLCEEDGVSVHCVVQSHREAS